MLNMAMGVDVTHVPYRGGAPATNDLIGKKVDYMLDVISTAKPQIDAQTVSGIAVLQEKRSALSPDVPSTAEAGYPQFKGMWWGGLAAPAGTPQPIVDRLNKELNELVKSAEFLKLLDTLGYLPVGGPAQKLQERAEEEAQMWKEIAERASVRVD